MIAFSNTGTGFKGAISYALKEHEKNLPAHQKPVVVEQNNIWGTSSEIAKQMRFIADSNSKSSRPVLHIAFSFHKDEKLPLEKSIEAMHLALQEINFHREKNQYLLVQHNDTDVEHYHWIINKVDLNAKNLDTSYIKNRLQVACDKVEKQLKLRYTQGRTIIYDPESEKGYKFTQKANLKNKIFKDKSINISDVKQFIYDELIRILSYLKTIEQLVPELSKKGIACQTTFNKNGLSGVSFRYNNQAYKGSQIGVKAKDIVNAIQQNQTLGSKDHITLLNAFHKNIQTTLKAIVADYETGNPYPDFEKCFLNNEIRYEDEKLFFKGYRISNKPIEYFRKAAETFVLGSLKNFEYKMYCYNDLMNQEPRKVPLLFGRDKILTENKQLLKEQQNAVEPQLKIRISRSIIPDFSGVFLKSIKHHKDKLAELTENKKTTIANIEKQKKIRKEVRIMLVKILRL
ncbi:relaxase/mobilization nuclease domain-containing protein [Flavobacterium sp. I3-2]|uniref:relaxase/mobilization nuclease domain-containing protein n=1 Tax=Flavobacterium sp. I3-2 TaxID=2748319 RepID=UPI0015AFE09A|nr:relaxase/mobilization nuclease domain-containing protein [Flavobacterium sp. I3-2]